jgi:hypothetical protein
MALEFFLLHLKKKKKEQKEPILARCWWLTPVILATWEADKRRIMA